MNLFNHQGADSEIENREELQSLVSILKLFKCSNGIPVLKPVQNYDTHEYAMDISPKL